MKKNNPKDKLELLAKLTKQTENLREELEKSIKIDIEEISKLTPSDVKSLMLEIYKDCMEIMNIDNKIAYHSIILRNMRNKKNKLRYQKNLTSKDILEETMYSLLNIIAIHNIAFIGIIVSSKTFEEMIRNILITLIISLSAYNINLKYFTSNHYKNKLSIKLSDVENDIKINELYIYLYSMYKMYFTKETHIEVTKLLELSPEILEVVNNDQKLSQIFIENNKIKQRKR